MNTVQWVLSQTHPRIKQQLENSLMLVTALNTNIGYENAAKIAKPHTKWHPHYEEAINLGLSVCRRF